MERANEERYRLASAGVETQLTRAEHLDSKVTNLVTLCGTLMTLFLGLGTFVLDKVPRGNPYFVSLSWSLALGLTSFTADVLVLVWAYRLRKYKLGVEPKSLTNMEKGGLGPYQYPDLIRQLTADLVYAATENKKLNDRRTRLVGLGFVLLGLATVLTLTYGILLLEAFSAP